jgi:hypothetical protein
MSTQTQHSLETAERSGDEALLVEELRKAKPDVAPTVIRILERARSPGVRNTAALALADMRAAGARDSLIEALRKEETRGHRGTILYALDELGADLPLSLLVDLIVEDPYEAREEALGFLAAGRVDRDTDPSEVERTLRAALTQADEERSHAIRESLEYLSGYAPTPPPFVIDDKLHFKTGKMGQLARFFAKRRAARDPIDETVILPPLIFLLIERLYDLGRINAWGLLASLIIPASFAGFWIGACLGERGTFVAVLRGFLVGGIAGAASVGILKQTLTQREALQYTVNLMYLNVFCFWFFSIISSAMSGIATVSEKDWQNGVVRRDYVKRVNRNLLSWCYDTVAIALSVLSIAFSRKNISLYAIALAPVMIVILWIYNGTSFWSAFDFLFQNPIGVKS